MRFRRAHTVQRRRILESGLFDGEWYRSQFPQAAPSGDLLEHYLQNGARLSFTPSRNFDAAWYLKSNPDVAATGVNPLLHYVIWGQGEGREARKVVHQESLSELRDKLLSFQEKHQADVRHLRSENEFLRTAVEQSQSSALGDIADLRQEFSSWRERSEADLKDVVSQNEMFRGQIGYILEMTSDLPRERQRLDYVLGELEGIGKLYLDLRAARKTPEFQSAFDQPSPLVTVCTGTTDQPKVIVDRCLKSIREQTYENLQILIIGDHCSDETVERIAELKDSRIEFHNLPRRGPYPRPGLDRWYVAGTNAANASQPLARGKFITYLDDDDRYEPDRIETLVKLAQANRAEFLWHKFWYLQPDGTWALWGNGKLEQGQVGTSMTFYHNYFSKIPWDMNAYRIPEPGDWNRLRKIKHLRPNAVFVDKPLTWYYKNYEATPFVAQDGEEFLD